VPTTTIEAVEQGALVATEERNRMDLGDAPVADLPDLITSQGIWASGAALPDEMSGLFVRHSTFGMAILVNLSHVRARQRFSYAHEFGHALMDRDHAVNVTTQTNSNDLIEKRANAFAAAFLAPKAGVEWILEALDKGGPSRVERAIYSVATNNGVEAEGRAIPGSQAITYQDVAIIAHHFGISFQAAIYRLRSLDIINKQECEELLKREELGREYLDVLKLKNDIEGKETAEPDRELVTQVVHAAVEAYRREEITDARMLDISKRLGLQGQRLLALAKAARDS
jgi:Zn-dependent peptidase ImmA (M78 family)